MPELDDNKTDKLFQVGAGRHDFEYAPAAWEQMEGLLDADDAARRRKFWLLGAALLLALLLAAGYGYRTVTADAGVPAGAIAATAEVPTVSIAPKKTTQNNSALLAEEEPVDSKTPVVEMLTGQNDPGAPADPAKTARAQRPFTAGVQPPVAYALNEQTISSSGGIAAENSAGSPVISKSKAILTIPSIALTTIDGPAPDPKGPTRVTPDEVRGVSPPTATPTATFVPGFAATVSAGLTSGTTEIGEFGPRDTRFGAKLDYRFSNKLSVGLGGYYSNVCYNIEGAEYKAANASFPAGLPKNVESDCDIFEVPLSLTWHPHGSDQSGFYVGGGLTSYFMLIERFTFKYDEPVGPNAPRSWREDNANQHLFGMGQFNLGYQRRAGQRSAFQVETFVQLPLTDIGHGNVNLMTVGASVNYTFDFRRKRK